VKQLYAWTQRHKFPLETELYFVFFQKISVFFGVFLFFFGFFHKKGVFKHLLNLFTIGMGIALFGVEL